jgi:pimeloyl-ACP methyl ester carboxylesterase
MRKLKRLFRSFSRLLLPVVILLALATVAGSVWFNYAVARPKNNIYLVTPEKYGQLSARGAQITEESWTGGNTTSRGWLLRGSENAPAVILLHRYGTDRSHVLNLGVKLNEATNFTVLMPDARGHGEKPPVKSSSFGGCETEDTVAAITFLRDLKSASGKSLIGQNIGIYGVEMGALSAISAAAQVETVKALVLDSVPQTADEVLASAIEKRFPFASSVTSKMAQTGTYFYFFDNCYNRSPICETVKTLNDRHVLLLAGNDAARYQDSTARLANCFPTTTKISSKTDLSPSGFSIINASLEQSEAYDLRVIEFFKTSLSY